MSGPEGRDSELGGGWSLPAGAAQRRAIRAAGSGLLGCGLTALFLQLAFWGGAAYVVLHFVMKWW